MENFMYGTSHQFVVGVATPETIEVLRERTEAAPLEIIHQPLVYFSGPMDDATRFASLSDEPIEMEITGFDFRYNLKIQITEFVIYLKPVFSTFMSDMRLDNTPYARLALDPMRSKKVRFWCNSLGNNLIGQRLRFYVSVADDEVLLQNYNIEADPDQGKTYSGW